MSRRGPLAPVRSIKTKLGLVVVGATGAGLLGAVYGLQSGFRVRWTLLLSLVVALAVVQLLARGMTAPLREMAAAASAMARGERDVRVAVTSHDEVGRLAQAFNGMAADLAEVDAQRRRLVADVSHELRTPLTALQAQLENMLDGVSGPETLAAALAQTARLTRLVAQLLDLSRLEAGQVPLHREPVEVARLAEDALAAAAALGRDVALVPRVDPPGLVVRADPERLHQVLANLLDNATRHSPPGGTVVLAASRHGDGVRLEVLDEGPGVAEDDRERVFSRFVRTDAARASAAGGSGLGLSIVRWIVDLHGGTVVVAPPPPSGGCRVVVDLPAVP